MITLEKRGCMNLFVFLIIMFLICGATTSVMYLTCIPLFFEGFPVSEKHRKQYSIAIILTTVIHVSIIVGLSMQASFYNMNKDSRYIVMHSPLSMFASSFCLCVFIWLMLFVVILFLNLIAGVCFTAKPVQLKEKA